MRLTNAEFLADVAAIYTGCETEGAFGSGRLIATGLILTAGHVVDYPTRETPTRIGWKVHLVGERKADRAWGDPHDAEVVWRGRDDLDLALLRLRGDITQRLKVEPVFASIERLEAIADVWAAGFPRAWSTDQETSDFKVPGMLWKATSNNSYAWIVPQAASPDQPTGWTGMSGAAACRVGPDDKLYLFGAVAEVPANFTYGQLAVAQLSSAFADDTFRKHLEAALGAAPRINPFKSWQTRQDLGIARLFQSRTQAFKAEYLVSETGPVPFGGRDHELIRLNAWFFDPDSPHRMMVTAPAGRGKSALLVQWMKTLEDGGVFGPEGWQLAFMPISIRVGTNRPEVFYKGIARRLAEILGDELPAASLSDPEGFRWAVADLLGRIGDRRVILVIDGIDEALQRSFDAAIFSKVLPPSMRIVLSARWQVGDSDSQGWLKRLGWDRGVNVASFELDPLQADGIGDVIAKLGAPVDVVAREPGLIERLRYLTEGEPLLVRYYAEDLWQLSGQRARITRADLDKLKPGFHSYFEQWFKNQETLWPQEDPRIDPSEVDLVLSVLAFARGPLEAADLLALMKQIHGTTGVLAADRLLEPLRRFVFGNGKRESGYVLSHPKIGEYLQQERFAASAREIHRGFADWGQAHLIDINTRRVAPEKASPYVLQFLPQHLDEAGATPEAFMMMVEDGCRGAWKRLEGGARGFASAVQAAWSAQRRNNSDLRLGAQWRCALTLSSIRSLGQHIPSELVLAAVQKGIFPHAQAVHVAKLQGASAITLQARLAVMARDSHALSNKLAMSALAMLRDQHIACNLLIELIDILFDVDYGLAPEFRPPVLAEALTVARCITDPKQRSSVLAALGPHVEPASRPLVFAEGFEAARSITDAKHRSRALAQLAPYVASKLRPVVLNEALAALKSFVSFESDQTSRTLAILAPYLTGKQLDEALALAKAIETVYGERKVALAALAPYFSPQQLDEALATTKANDGEGRRSEVLAALAPHLAPEQLDEALATAKAIEDPRYRSYALAMLAPHLVLELQPSVLGDALAASKSIRDSIARARVLGKLAARVAPELRPAVADETLMAVDTIYEGEWRSTVLCEVLPELALHLAPQQVDKAFAIAKATKATISYGDEEIDNYRPCAWALAALAPYLSPAHLDEALSAIESFSDDDSRATVLAALAPHLEPAQLTKALEVAMDRYGADDSAASYAVARLAPYLSLEQLDKAVTATKSTRYESSRSRALADLAPYLAQKTPAEALTIAKAIGNKKDRLRALGAMAQYLAPEQLEEALAIAELIGDEQDRFSTLRALAPHLAPEFRSAVYEEIVAVARTGGFTAALGPLAPNLAPELLPIAFRDAIATEKAIHGFSERSRALANVLTLFAPHLEPEQLDEALVAAWAIESTNERSEALAKLARYCGPKQIAEAVAAAKALNTAEGRSRALAALAPYVPSELLPTVLDEAAAAAKVIDNDFCQAEALRALAPYLGQRQLHEVLAAVTNSNRFRLDALLKLAPYLSPEQINRAFSFATFISNSEDRFNALVRLAPHLAPELRITCYGEALAAARSIDDEKKRKEALAALAPYLAANQLDQALATVNTLGGESHRSNALVKLAPYLGPWQLTKALAIAKAINDEGCRSWALEGLAPYLAAEQIDEALTAALDIGEDGARSEALVALAPHLGPKQLMGAFAAAKAINRSSSRSWALRVLASHAAPELRLACISEAFAATKAIDDAESCAKALAELAPYLSATQLDEALAYVKASDDIRVRSNALAALAPHLKSEQIEEALAISKGVFWRFQSHVLAALAPRLSLQQIDEALAAAKAIDDAEARSKALAALAPHLLPGQLVEALASAIAITEEKYLNCAIDVLAPRLGRQQWDEILAATMSIGNKEHRASVMAALVPHLVPNQPDKALVAAMSIGDTERGSSVLAVLVPYFMSNQPEKALAAAKAIGDEELHSKALITLANCSAAIQCDTLLVLIDASGNMLRGRALSTAAAVVRPTFKCGGQEAINEVWKAISDVCRWYP